MIDASNILGTHDVLFIVLDALRYDAARMALERGLTPNLKRWLPGGAWERRHSPGSFTFPAHQAFFAGFLPTPATPGRHPRLFAAEFAGSETTTAQTLVFQTADIVRGFAAAGYHTACIGGVGFFNQRTELGKVLPGMFAESHWSPEIGVTSPDSTARQVALALSILRERRERVFLFINVSAIHQPNCIFTPGATTDTIKTHIAALAYVDSQLPPLFAEMGRRGPALAIVCSDHGTAYGEDGFEGHRMAHPVIYTVPYAEFVIPLTGGGA